MAAAVGGVLATQAPDGIEVEDLFRLAPLPNWCFQRDPQVVLGDGVVFGAMATAARWREGVLTRCVFRFHPELADTSVILDPLREAGSSDNLLGPHRPRLEGGDVLVLSPDIVAVGISERTNAVAVEMLAAALAGLRRRSALARGRPRPRAAAPTCTSTPSSPRSIATRRWSSHR